jgi:hypothetical protein
MARKDAKEKTKEKSPRRGEAEDQQAGGEGGGVAVAEQGGGGVEEESGQAGAAEGPPFSVGDYVQVTSTDPGDAKYLGQKAKVVERDSLGGVIIRGAWDGPEWEEGGEELVFEDTLLARWTEPATEPAEQPSPVQAAAEETAATVLSESDRRFLARRNAVEAALKNIDEALADHADAIVKHEAAGKHKKATEAALEAAYNRLVRAERSEPEAEQGLLPFKGSTAPASSNGEAHGDLAERQRAWDAKWEEFLGQEIAVLGLSEGLHEKLATAEIATLKDLTTTKAESEGQGYTVIDGIGTANADKIDDAYEKLLQAFLAENPQPKQPETAALPPEPAADDAAVQADPGSYDFVDTFPPPTHPTPNESYDSDYHRSIIKDAEDELTELRSCKECLSRNVNESGKPLTDKTRKSIETKLGEVQLQYDEGISLYAEKFGNTAADALRRHVEAAVDKQASLKGGLE